MKLLKTVSRELAISAERSTVRQAEYRKVAKKHVEDARRVQVQDPTTLEPTAMKARMKLGAHLLELLAKSDGMCSRFHREPDSSQIRDTFPLRKE
jgi:hypothetical protein